MVMIEINDVNTGRKVDVVYGGQFGSESKRLFIEYYINNFKPDMIISNFGPNSGGFASDGSKWATFPMRFDGKIMLSPGSIINVYNFIEEFNYLPDGAEVYIHENACYVNDDNIKDESSRVTIGSTMTGTMEAAVQKMRRNIDNNNTAVTNKNLNIFTVNNKQWIKMILDAKRILLAVPQGHSLSLNFGFYPYCTSRNTSPQQALADAGIPIWMVDKIIGCFRTFPIRVSNRYDDDDNMIGFSGPCYSDQKELIWEEVGVPPEITSISKKVRRVFTFSEEQYVESILMNGCTHVFLNFMNYLSPYLQEKLLSRLSRLGTPAKISWLGYGPTINDIKGGIKHDINTY